MSEYNLYNLCTDPGQASWSSPSDELNGDEYFDWLKLERGQVLGVLIRRLAVGHARENDLRISGRHASRLRSYLSEESADQYRQMRAAGTDRVPEMGSLF